MREKTVDRSVFFNKNVKRFSEVHVKKKKTM